MVITNPTQGLGSYKVQPKAMVVTKFNQRSWYLQSPAQSQWCFRKDHPKTVHIISWGTMQAKRVFHHEATVW